MPEPSAAPLPTPSAWRRCLLLCLPALVLGAILRIAFMSHLPEGYYGPDSNSYFDTASTLLLHGKWDLGPKRRWVYPILLIAAPKIPGRPVITIAAVQHAVGLLTVLGIGWIVFHLTRRPKIWVPVVTTIAAIWPRMIWYEHEIIAESLLLSSIVLAVALAYPVERLRDPKRLFWFLLAAALIVAVKPHGRPIWLGLMLSAVLLAGVPWRWSKACWAAVGVSVLVILTTGSSKQGPWLLLSSTFPLVNTEQGKWPEYRKILKPYIEEARGDISQYPWKQDRYKKMLVESGDDQTLGPEWNHLLSEDPKRETKFLTVCRDLARDAILHAPFTYARMVLQKIGMVLSDESAGMGMSPRTFWAGQLKDNEGRWTRHPDEMQLLYRFDYDGYLKLADERRHQNAWYLPTVYRLSHAFAWMRTVRTLPGGKRTLHPAWFGMLALFGFLTCLRPKRWRETAPLWLPLGLFLVIIFSIGDSVPRYLQPVDWIGIIFVGVGLDWVLAWLWRPQKRVEETISTEAPAVSPTNAPIET